jgi:hypothetical protein
LKKLIKATVDQLKKKYPWTVNYRLVRKTRA